MEACENDTNRKEGLHMEDVLDKLFDENNSENIILFNEDDEAVEFEQVAIIPLFGTVYVILKPANPMFGIADDEALVFAVETVEGEECLTILEDDEMVDHVFEEYYKLLRENGVL